MIRRLIAVLAAVGALAGCESSSGPDLAVGGADLAVAGADLAGGGADLSIVGGADLAVAGADLAAGGGLDLAGVMPIQAPMNSWTSTTEPYFSRTVCRSDQAASSFPTSEARMTSLAVSNTTSSWGMR